MWQKQRWPRGEAVVLGGARAEVSAWHPRVPQYKGAWMSCGSRCTSPPAPRTQALACANSWFTHTPLCKVLPAEGLVLWPFAAPRVWHRSDVSLRSGASGRPGQWSRRSGSAAAPAGRSGARHRPAGPGTAAPSRAGQAAVPGVELLSDGHGQLHKVPGSSCAPLPPLQSSGGAGRPWPQPEACCRLGFGWGGGGTSVWSSSAATSAGRRGDGSSNQTL